MPMASVALAWEHVTITLQALSLVEETGWSKCTSHYAWGTNGAYACKMDVKSTWTLTWHQMDHVSRSLDFSKKPPLRGRPNTTRETTALCWFILYYHVWRHAQIDIHSNNIWLRAYLHMTSHYTWRSLITLHDFIRPFGNFLLGSHNFMVMALGSCVKWPLHACSGHTFTNIIKCSICVLWDCTSIF